MNRVTCHLRFVLLLRELNSTDVTQRLLHLNSVTEHVVEKTELLLICNYVAINKSTSVFYGLYSILIDHKITSYNV